LERAEIPQPDIKCWKKSHESDFKCREGT